MASQWLRTLQKIDWHRQEQIKKVRSLGYTIGDDASFDELTKYIGYNAVSDKPDNAFTQDIPWRRPEEWPDCFEILKTAPIKNAGNYPGIIILFKDIEDVLNINSEAFVKENSNQVCLGACKGILTSDGAYYTNTTFSHTWDKSKDIIVDKGRFPGIYRWIILYYSSRNGIADLNLVGLPATEIILGKIGSEAASSATINASLIGRYDDNELNATNTLINLEFTNDFNLTVMQWCYGASGSGYSAMGKFDVLEHVNLGPLTVWANSAYGSTPFYTAPRLIDLHCPSISSLLRNGEYQFSNLPQLQRMYFPRFETSTSIVIHYINNLRELIMPGARAYLGYSSGDQGNTPDDINIQVESISYYGPQALWTNNKASINGATNSYRTYYQGFSSLRTFDFNVQKTYTSSTLVTSNSSDMELMQFPRLRTVILYKDWNRRLDTSWACLGRGCILEMFYNLLDLTSDPNMVCYDPIIMLSDQDKKELTEEDIKIATDKGWIIK